LAYAALQTSAVIGKNSRLLDVRVRCLPGSDHVMDRGTIERGFGFAKSVAHNVALLRSMDARSASAWLPASAAH
jgi:hypothetical protein